MKALPAVVLFLLSVSAVHTSPFNPPITAQLHTARTACRRTTTAFHLPLPGGKSIHYDSDSGLLRISLDDAYRQTLPPLPPPDTPPTQSIKVQHTGCSKKGYGAFTTAPLPKNTFLGFYQGELFSSREELEQSYKSRGLSVQRDMHHVMAINGGAEFVDGYEVAKNRDQFTPAHMNHAEKEKEDCNVLRVAEGCQVAFFTSREVEEGEELLFDYGGNFWTGDRRPVQ